MGIWHKCSSCGYHFEVAKWRVSARPEHPCAHCRVVQKIVTSRPTSKGISLSCRALLVRPSKPAVLDGASPQAVTDDDDTQEPKAESPQNVPTDSPTTRPERGVVGHPALQRATLRQEVVLPPMSPAALKNYRCGKEQEFNLVQMQLRAAECLITLIDQGGIATTSARITAGQLKRLFDTRDQVAIKQGVVGGVLQRVGVYCGNTSNRLQAWEIVQARPQLEALATELERSLASIRRFLEAAKRMA